MSNLNYLSTVNQITDSDGQIYRVIKDCTVPMSQLAGWTGVGLLGTEGSAYAPGACIQDIQGTRRSCAVWFMPQPTDGNWVNGITSDGSTIDEFNLNYPGASDNDHYSYVEPRVVFYKDSSAGYVFKGIYEAQPKGTTPNGLLSFVDANGRATFKRVSKVYKW